MGAAEPDRSLGSRRRGACKGRGLDKVSVAQVHEEVLLLKENEQAVGTIVVHLQHG